MLSSLVLATALSDYTKKMFESYFSDRLTFTVGLLVEFLVEFIDLLEQFFLLMHFIGGWDNYGIVTQGPVSIVGKLCYALSLLLAVLSFELS